MPRDTAMAIICVRVRARSRPLAFSTNSWVVDGAMSIRKRSAYRWVAEIARTAVKSLPIDTGSTWRFEICWYVGVLLH